LALAEGAQILIVTDLICSYYCNVLVWWSNNAYVPPRSQGEGKRAVLIDYR